MQASYRESEIEEVSSDNLGISEEAAAAGRGTVNCGGSGGVGRDYIYVAVGKDNSSMDALAWTLKNIATPGSSLVYLVHVFPEVHHIPTPLGMLPRDQLRPFQVEAYLDQERTKRREMLQKLLSMCQASKVDVDTILIESNLIAKAIIDLIPVLNIRTLVVGTSKSNMRKLMKGSSIAEQVNRSAPEYCEVKIICDNREVTDTERTTMSPPAPVSDDTNLPKHRNKFVKSCTCFF